MPLLTSLPVCLQEQLASLQQRASEAEAREAAAQQRLQEVCCRLRRETDLLVRWR